MACATVGRHNEAEWASHSAANARFAALKWARPQPIAFGLMSNVPVAPLHGALLSAPLAAGCTSTLDAAHELNSAP